MEATSLTFEPGLRQIRDARLPGDPIISESKGVTGDIEAEK
jgi:hypothetical protein